jgi:hypothetical protein
LRLNPDFMPLFKRCRVSMPIKRELRWFYPSDWRDISRRVRIERASGVCQGCRRPHGQIVRCPPDRHWFDVAAATTGSVSGRASKYSRA